MDEFFIPRWSTDDLFDDMWVVYDELYDADADSDDSEYSTDYGTELDTSEDEDYTIIAEHRRIDFFELDDWGLEQLFQN